MEPDTPYRSPDHDDPEFADRPRGPQPGVVLWYKIYCGLAVFGSLLLVGLGAAFVFVEDLARAFNEGQDASGTGVEATIVGVIYALGGLLLLALHVVPFLLRPTRGSWIYGIVLLALGCTGICCLATIPLLIFWVQEPTRRWHGA